MSESPSSARSWEGGDLRLFLSSQQNLGTSTGPSVLYCTMKWPAAGAAQFADGLFVLSPPSACGQMNGLMWFLHRISTHSLLKAVCSGIWTCKGEPRALCFKPSSAPGMLHCVTSPMHVYFPRVFEYQTGVGAVIASSGVVWECLVLVQCLGVKYLGNCHHNDERSRKQA